MVGLCCHFMVYHPSCHIATSYTISKNNLSFSCFWFDLGLRRHKSDIGGDCWVGWAITGAGPEMGGVGRHSYSCSQPLQPLLTLLMPPLQTTLGCSGFYQSMFPSCSLKQLGHEYWWQRPHNASRIIFAKSEIETGNQKCANSQLSINLLLIIWQILYICTTNQTLLQTCSILKIHNRSLLNTTSWYKLHVVVEKGPIRFQDWSWAVWQASKGLLLASDVTWFHICTDIA